MKLGIVVLVACCLMVDHMLLTVVIPILPQLLVDDMGVPEVALYIFFSGKAAVQILANPFVGAVVAKRGPRLPMLLGTSILVASTAASGYAMIDESLLSGWLASSRWRLFAVLAVARAAQGVGSAFLMCAGLCLVTNCHAEDERGTALGAAMTGVAGGVLLGAPVGGVVAQAFGRPVPFFALSGLAAVAFAAASAFVPRGVLNDSNCDDEGSSGLGALLRVPGVKPSLLSVLAANGLVGLLEPIVPLRLAGAPYHLGSRDQGLVFGVATLAYLAFTPLAGAASDAVRHRSGCLVGGGLVTAGLGAAATGLPGAWGLAPVLGGLAAFGLGIALVDVPTLPLLTALVEAENAANAGGGGGVAVASVFAAQDSATSLGFVLGPLAAALASASLGSLYPGLPVGAAAACFGLPVAVLLARAEADAAAAAARGGSGGRADMADTVVGPNPLGHRLLPGGGYADLRDNDHSDLKKRGEPWGMYDSRAMSSDGSQANRDRLLV